MRFLSHATFLSGSKTRRKNPSPHYFSALKPYTGTKLPVASRVCFEELKQNWSGIHSNKTARSIIECSFSPPTTRATPTPKQRSKTESKEATTQHRASGWRKDFTVGVYNITLCGVLCHNRNSKTQRESETAQEAIELHPSGHNYSSLPPLLDCNAIRTSHRKTHIASHRIASQNTHRNTSVV